jgi:hypothetical protein
MKFQAEEDIDSFLAACEAGTIPKHEWTHQAHLAMAGAYVWSDPDSALARVRFGILFLNRCHQTRNSADSGYHETLTVFWVVVVKAFCKRRAADTRLRAINEMLATLPADLFRQFYGFDVVTSRRARERWVEPDLQALPDEQGYGNEKT